MAYAGYLFKIGDYVFPLSLIKADSYSAYKSVTDLDSYVDENGELHRNALDHLAYKVEFETPAMLNNKQLSTLFANIYAQFTNQLERKASCTLYIPEIDGYVTCDMYMPDVKPQMYYADANLIQYDAIRFAFISY
jgi:hypothetical protein